MTSDAPPSGRNSGAWRTVAHSAGARLVVLPVSAILGIVVTRLILSHFGEAAYGQYGLLVGLGALIPFADLGITAAIINSIGRSDDARTDPDVQATLITCFRIVAGSCVVLLAIAVTLTSTGGWSGLLGHGLLPGSGSLAAGLCLGLFGFNVLVGFGQQVLTALGKNHIPVLLQGLQTPLVLITILLIIATGADLGGYVAVSAYGATFLLSVWAAGLAARRIQPNFGRALRLARRIRTVKGGNVFATALPLMVLMVAIPIAMQTDRVVLSHVSDLENLAEYNLASQIFTPVWSVINAAGAALWPIFARARATDRAPSVGPGRLALGFGAGSALVCLVLALAAPWLSARASGGVIHLGVPLLASFSALMFVQGLNYPLGIYLTDARGLRFQAYMALLLLPLNLGLSWYLAGVWGAVGPVIGSAVGVLVCQLFANHLYLRATARRAGVPGPALATAGGAE